MARSYEAENGIKLEVTQGHEPGQVGQLCMAISEKAAQRRPIDVADRAIDEAGEFMEADVKANLNAHDAGGGASRSLVLKVVDLFAEEVDGGLDFGGVFAGDGNLLALEFHRAIGNGRLDFAVGGRGNGDDVSQIEVGRAKLSELADEAIGVGPADACVFGAELFPGEVEVFVSFRIADLLETSDAGGGPVLGYYVESLLPAHPGSEGDGCVVEFIHIDP